MLLSSVIPCLYFLLLHALPVAPPGVGYIPTMLTLPYTSEQHTTFPASDFCATVIPAKCPQGSATVHSLQLRKFTSWTNWWHEFIILAVTYQETDYFIHVNRAWAGTGWWEYIPYPTRGSMKPAANDISIYLPGVEESRERDGTDLIAQINFDSGISLRDIAGRIAHRIDDAGPYSLFGVNCWAWSRYMTLDIARKWTSFVQDVQMPEKGGPVDVFALLMELSLDPWVNWSQFTINKAIRPSFARRILHGMSPLFSHLYDKLFPGDSSSPWSFARSLELTITNKETRDSRGSLVCDAPHTFARQWAVDSSNSTYANSLSLPGDFLYLLTPPLIVPKPVHLVVIRTSAQGVPSLKRRWSRRVAEMRSCVSFETAIVHHDPVNNTLQIAGERFGIPWDSSDESDQLYSMDKDHEFVQQLDDGYMVGVWVRAQCPGWENRVKFVALNIINDECCRRLQCCTK